MLSTIFGIILGLVSLLVILFALIGFGGDVIKGKGKEIMWALIFLIGVAGLFGWGSVALLTKEESKKEPVQQEAVNEETDAKDKEEAKAKKESDEKAKIEAEAKAKAEAEAEAEAKQVNIKVDHSKQSEDDDDNTITRAIEPTIVEGLKNLNPNFLKEVIVNVNLARKTPIENDTRVELDVLFVKGTEKKNKETTIVEIAKQLSKVNNLNKLTIWTYEKEMYNPNETNQYMMVVYTKYLPLTNELTFDKLVEASNNGSINGEVYFNQDRD